MDRLTSGLPLAVQPPIGTAPTAPTALAHFLLSAVRDPQSAALPWKTSPGHSATERRGVYICPNNETLHTTGTVHDGNALRYRASKFDCDICALKMQCCPNTPARQIPRDIHEDARDLARRIMGTKRFLKSRDERKRVEMRFAHLKIHHGFERMRLRGLSGARDEFHLAAIVQNLKTLALRAFKLQTPHNPPHSP
jgi:Transposase DDE domain